MPLYRYKAKDMNGKNISGVLETADGNMLYQALKEENKFVYFIKEKEEKEKTLRIKSKDLAEFSNQLGTMLVAGISLPRALSIIAQRCTSRKLKEVYTDLYVQVQRGVLLSDALEQQGRAFPVLFINMVRAGESSGQMAKIAMKLANHYEKDNRLQAKVRGAMVYPCILLGLTFVVVIVLFTLILPSFFSLFKDMKDKLPVTTRAMISFSKFLTSHGIMSLLIFLIIVCVIVLLFQTTAVKNKLDYCKLHLPILKPIFTTIYTARFARGLSSLYSSGLSMIQSLQICKGLIGNSFVEKQFYDMILDVKNGVTLSKTMNGRVGFDTKLVASVYVGEESGRITEILENMADSFDYEAEQATSRLITLIEPLMIILMALLIGTIMISVMVPVVTYYQSLMQ